MERISIVHPANESERTVLYMVAIMPPAVLSSTIHEKRVDFSKKYSYVAALKPPVHITLFEPFLIRESDVPLFEENLNKIQKWAEHQQAFDINLLNYNFFNNREHPVVYIDVVKNTFLKQLHSGFLRQLRKFVSLDHPSSPSYKPHITIGYRDIPAKTFSSIKADYRQQAFSGSFNCGSIYLWKHDRKNWQIEREFQFKYKLQQLSLF